MTPGKSPSSTASSSGSTLTLLHWRRPDFNQTIASENKTTCSFGKGSWPRLLALQHLPLWCRQVEWEWAEAVGTMLLPQPLCNQLNTFSTKPNRRVSWNYPRSRHWHQLDPFSLVSSVPVVTTVLTATPQWALFTGHDIRIKQAYTVCRSLLRFHGFVYCFIAYLVIYCYMQYYYFSKTLKIIFHPCKLVNNFFILGSSCSTTRTHTCQKWTTSERNIRAQVSWIIYHHFGY